MESDKAQYDFYKSIGIITLKIEKFSEFTQGPEGLDGDGCRVSDPIYVRGLPWKILAQARTDMLGEKYLYFLLERNATNEDAMYNRHASAILKVLAQKEGKQDYVQEIEHDYSAKQKYWGISWFMTFEELMDPKNGWYDESTDSIILRAEISADIPIPIDIVMQTQACEDMDNLFGKGDKYSDCTLVSSDGVKFKVYKGILACRSPVFAAMFEHKMVEAQNGIVEIEDIRSEVLEQLLRFIYSGKQPNMENIAEELLAAADKYELAQLKKFCECNLATSLDDENACGFLVMADQYSAKHLKVEAIKYIRKNAGKVTQTEGWKMLLNGNYGELVHQIVEEFVRIVEEFVRKEHEK